MNITRFVIVATLFAVVLILAQSASADPEPLDAVTARYNARYAMYFDEPNNQIYWYHSLKGDCDQNGVVNISDLSRLGNYLNQSVTDQSLAIAAADCDGNGEVNINDLSAMGAHMGEQLTGCNVYWEHDFAPGYPLHSDDINEDIVSWKTIVDFDPDAVGDPVVDHLRYNVDATGIEKYWFWAQEELAGPVGRLSRMQMASDSSNTAINTYAPFTWGTSFDPGTSNFTFHHTFRGDLNQSGSMDLNDLTPVGAHFGSAGPWTVADEERAIDANRDNAIDFADAFISGNLMFGQSLAGPPGGYNVYYLPSGGDPLPYSDAGILVAHLDLGSADMVNQRKSYTVNLNATQAFPDNVVWVRPVGPDGELGARSEVLTIP